jgi:uncharacterized protein
MIQMNYLTKSRIRNLLIFSFLLLSFAVWSKDLPQPTGQLVSDFADMLTPNEEQTLERKLKLFNDSSSTQVAIVIETSLDGEDVFDYSYRLAQKWGIGQDAKNNGILIFISKNDKKIRIQTGTGAEGFLPDALCKRIIESIIKPAFKEGKYYAGLNGATNKIIALHAGEYSADAQSADGRMIVFLIFLLMVLLIFYMAYRYNKKYGSNGGGYYRNGRYNDYDDWNDPNPYRRNSRSSGGWIIGGGGFGGGGGSDDSGGGGFGGFGGGDFGGGGAGGDW